MASLNHNRFTRVAYFDHITFPSAALSATLEKYNYLTQLVAFHPLICINFSPNLRPTRFNIPTIMKLHLVHGSHPMDTTLCLRRSEIDDSELANVDDNDSSQWEPVYRIKTPSFLKISKPSTIYKIRSLHNGSRTVGGDSGQSNSNGEEIARIQWHVFSDARFIYKGEILELKNFLPKTNFWGSKRTFKGQDGRSYEWTLGPLTCSLEMSDPNSPSSKPVEILHMRQDNHDLIDLIIVTWVYIETMRILNFQPHAVVS
ncbi:hypothetical protein C8Q75DRAFT_289326 [Abortiporus biennis]|nr:hypothetical protein C8Q75DRAFT_289326 [Abortiporus biennis]